MKIYQLQKKYLQTHQESYLSELYKHIKKLLFYIYKTETSNLPIYQIEDGIETITSRTIMQIANGDEIENFYSYLKRALTFWIIQNKTYNKKFVYDAELPSSESTPDWLITDSVISTIDRYLKDEPIKTKTRILNRIIKTVGNNRNINNSFYGLTMRERALLSFIYSEVKKLLCGI